MRAIFANICFFIMNRPHYNFEALPPDEFYLYRFKSVSLQKSITKLVIFEAIEANIWNMALVDYDEISNTADDFAVSNNQDMPKIFATIAQIIKHFLENLPNSVIYVKGNTALKQRLYQRIVSNNLEDILQFYEVLGVLADESTQTFDKTQIYTALIFQNKS